MVIQCIFLNKPKMSNIEMLPAEAKYITTQPAKVQLELENYEIYKVYCNTVFIQQQNLQRVLQLSQSTYMLPFR